MRKQGAISLDWEADYRDTKSALRRCEGKDHSGKAAPGNDQHK